MKENKYDNEQFFLKYNQMSRSREGLAGAGEWHELKKLLPDFNGKRVLDLGCGFGWHCLYAAEHGATEVIGIDISEKMLAEAENKKTSDVITYRKLPIEDIDYAADMFDVVISSLAFHYIASFDGVVKKIAHCLRAGGDFVFSVEHPVLTAEGRQDWHYANGETKPAHWPVDDYFIEGARTANFLGEAVTKYHKTLTTYLNTLLKYGFHITAIVEPAPSDHLLKTVPGMEDELRRPMMLLVSTKLNAVN